MDASSERPLTPPSPIRPPDAMRPDPPASEAPALDVTWRELDRGLWVGRADGTHVGMIEQGHRFTLTDANESVHRGFESLAAAQRAVTGPIPIDPVVRPAAAVSAATPRRSPRGLLSTPSLAMIALALGALALVSFLLLVV